MNVKIGYAPDVRDHVHAEPGDAAVGVDGGLHVGHLRAPVGRRGHVLDARLDPAERHAAQARERGHDDVLGIGAELHAEAAADLRRDDADLVLGHAERLREAVAERVRRLVRRPHGEPAAREVGRRRAPRAPPSGRRTGAG